MHSGVVVMVVVYTSLRVKMYRVGSVSSPMCAKGSRPRSTGVRFDAHFGLTLRTQNESSVALANLEPPTAGEEITTAELQFVGFQVP